jgi:hypothetical protein
VERGLLALAALAPLGVGAGRDTRSVGVGAGRHQDGHDLLGVAAVAGPVGEEVEQGALAGRLTVLDDPNAGELGVLVEETAKTVGLTALDGGGGLYRERVVPAEGHGGGVRGGGGIGGCGHGSSGSFGSRSP